MQRKSGHIGFLARNSVEFRNVRIHGLAERARGNSADNVAYRASFKTESQLRIVFGSGSL